MDRLVYRRIIRSKDVCISLHLTLLFTSLVVDLITRYLVSVAATQLQIKAKVLANENPVSHAQPISDDQIPNTTT